LRTERPSAPSRSGELVLVGGPPGAGKSTVADVLATTAKQPTVLLPADSFHLWIRSGFITPYLPDAHFQNEVVRTVMSDAACAYADGGYDVIAEGILGPWLLEPVRAACRARGVEVSYVVLRPNLEVTLARATTRVGRHLTDVEPIVGLYGAFTDLGTLESHVIDSSDQDTDQTVAAVAAGLRAGRFTLAA
jgi:chloramphenicol 3-O-phosphotransferase